MPSVSHGCISVSPPHPANIKIFSFLLFSRAFCALFFFLLLISALANSTAIICFNCSIHFTAKSDLTWEGRPPSLPSTGWYSREAPSGVPQAGALQEVPLTCPKCLEGPQVHPVAGETECLCLFEETPLGDEKQFSVCRRASDCMGFTGIATGPIGGSSEPSK